MEKKDSQIRTWYKFALQQMAAESRTKGVSIAFFSADTKRQSRTVFPKST